MGQIARFLRGDGGGNDRDLHLKASLRRIGERVHWPRRGERARTGARTEDRVVPLRRLDGVAAEHAFSLPSDG
jgi:hypothetical protein